LRLQDARDRRSSDLVPEILEGTLNPRIAPRPVFLGHAHHELPDLGKDTATAGLLPRRRPLARHQLPVPSQQRVRRDDRREVMQGLPTEPVGSHGEAPPVSGRQPQATPTDLFPQETILFDQIGERLSLPAIEPAGDGEEQQAEHRHVDHERELISHG
jgi:hypothetical protein